MANALPLISVIVPVYNVENYLDTCVQSIVDQTYTNLEILLVDDGSPDNCGAMCDAWAEKDARIRVIHKENGGLSDARNVGVAAARGEYIGFIDSDDWIEPSMYELLYAAIEKADAQIAECKWEHFSEEKPARTYSGDRNNTEIQVFSAEQALSELICEKLFKQTVVNKLYHRSMLSNVPFRVGVLNEDEYWTYQVFGDAQTLVLVDAALYHYYQRSGSIMHTYTKRHVQCVDAYEQRMKYMKERFPSLYGKAAESYIFSCFYHYQKLCRENEVDTDGVLRKQLHDRFCKEDRQAMKQTVSLKYKVWYALFTACPRFTCYIRNVLKIGL